MCASNSRSDYNLTMVRRVKQTSCPSGKVQQVYMPLEFATRVCCYGASLRCTLLPGLPDDRAIESQHLSLCGIRPRLCQPPWDTRQHYMLHSALTGACTCLIGTPAGQIHAERALPSILPNVHDCCGGRKTLRRFDVMTCH